MIREPKAELISGTVGCTVVVKDHPQSALFQDLLAKTPEDQLDLPLNAPYFI